MYGVTELYRQRVVGQSKMIQDSATIIKTAGHITDRAMVKLQKAERRAARYRNALMLSLLANVALIWRLAHT